MLSPIVKFLGRQKLAYIEYRRRKGVRIKHRATIEKNLALKDFIKDKRCFIIGNGPSLAGQDLSNIAGQPCITVSNGFVHPLFNVLKPEFHVFAMAHKPITEEQLHAWFADAEKHFAPKQKIFICATDKVTVEKFRLFEKQHVFYYAPGNKKVSDIKEIELTKMLPRYHTVVHIAMYLALYGGASEIVLLGCDHDWIQHVGKSRHFYDEKEHAMVRKGLNEWGNDMQKRFISYVNLWERYKEIRAYAKRHHVQIWNATPGGMLDVFPRRELQELTSKSQS